MITVLWKNVEHIALRGATHYYVTGESIPYAQFTLDPITEPIVVEVSRNKWLVAIQRLSQTPGSYRAVAVLDNAHAAEEVLKSLQ